MSPLGLRAPFGPKKRKSSSDGGAADALTPARRRPTASISSMNTMHCPPHFAASFLALRAR
jgi:hypothetical protein